MKEQITTVVVPEFGGPEMYSAEQVDIPVPDKGQTLVKLSVSGVNFLDVAQRIGATPVEAPFPAGVEGVGVVSALGAGVDGFSIGQRVGWLAGGQGSFSDYAVVDAAKLVAIPERIDDDAAVSLLMQGVTAHYLTTDTFPIKAGDVVLVHAAAGGVGQLLTQIAKLKGATVIGTTSTLEKAEIARRNGADHVFGYDDFAEWTREVTGGIGASVVYDGVGADTFADSLRALRVRGTLVLIGNASGPVPPFDVNTLNTGGSLFLTRPTVMHHIRTAEELQRRAYDIFEWAVSGAISVSIGARYRIGEVAEAFRALESRSTTGKIVLEH
ncbi:quinone oxidoreductase family protein [Agromyces laixinhei]|uniref:quinone oxidoreductase family protein n=1 Tax=Agromyces laixinhei TaxID=2585717 RepID=UPI0012EE3046|nr:quinone oxidoreductase [Agromyces laixinhei]